MAAESRIIRLDPDETRTLLQETATAYNTRINDLLLAALAAALVRRTGSGRGRARAGGAWPRGLRRRRGRVAHRRLVHQPASRAAGPAAVRRGRARLGRHHPQREGAASRDPRQRAGLRRTALPVVRLRDPRRAGGAAGAVAVLQLSRPARCRGRRLEHRGGSAGPDGRPGEPARPRRSTSPRAGDRRPLRGPLHRRSRGLARQRTRGARGGRISPICCAT